MKKIKYKNALILMIGFSLIMASCKKSFYTNVNINPNAPSAVVPKVLLSTTEAALAYTQGGDISRFTSLIDQQTFGNTNQAAGYYRYIFNPGTFDNLWPDLYTSTMENNYALMTQADAEGDNAYSGVSRIVMAYTLQVSVDLWGSIPYSTALKGADQLHPAFDNDKALYDTISNLIDAGITFLNNVNAGPLTPGGEDVVYGGNASNWIKFGHAIKARLFIHQSKGNAAMATSALSEIALSFTSNADNAQYTFGSTETTANPWYQFNEQRGDIKFSTTTLATQLLNLHDPRYPVFIDSNNDALGSTSATPTSPVYYGGLPAYYGAINSPVEFITYDELLFMKAEATITASGDVGTAQIYYTAAIAANMNKLGISQNAINTYLGANGTLPATPAAAIAQVASQEYIALYLNPEAWVLWRRTGSPGLLPVTGNSIPRRLLYPQSEYSYNASNVPQSVTLFTPKIFWDN
jgi:SusD/RagB-like outer membrane lipoprotein